MSEITVVTSFSYEGYQLYGRRFLETFLQFWPKNIRFLLYHEGGFDFGLDLLKESPACADFLSRHENDLVSKGRMVNMPGKWKVRDIEKGYNFRYDAFKFARKVFAIEAAAKRLKQGLLFWLDADIFTHKPLSFTFLESLLPSSIDVCFLGRELKHSECGFVGYALDHVEVKNMIHYFAELYATDQVFTLQEWHDSYVFDICRLQFHLRGNNLSRLDRGNVFDTSCLGEYMRHLKGNRKLKGKGLLELHAI